MRDASALSMAIERSCRTKAVISSPPTNVKTGERALLNLGHTFGHAIEKSRWVDGCAAAW